MRQYLKNKHFKNTLIVILICLIAVVATIYCISESNAKKEEVKSLVRKYDLTTEENSSATLIIKSRLSNKQLEELGAEQIVKYGEYKVVKFNSQEDMKERLAELQEQKVEVEVDTLVDVATILSETTSTKTNETTPSTPEKGANTLQQYLENNPSKEIVKVAIIDTGIDKENELFKDRIIDTQLNYSTTGEENDITDDYGHGTIIAEIIAKKTDSNIKLMPIKVANKNGKSTVLSVYMAINEAISQGADVINISMNTFSQSDLLREAIDKANEVGIKVVVSSGNLGIDVENIAPSNIESAIVVGAVHSNLDYEGFSNYGDTVDYCSYGVYDSDYGTSISAAHISAVIAALESSGVAPAEIESTMDQYIQDLGETGKDKYYGKGFISLYNAEECFTTTADEDLEANANKRKEMLQKLLKADWKSMTDDEFNTLISEIDYDIVGYFLKTLTEEDFNTLTSRDTVLKNPITVRTAYIITDVSQIETTNWPDEPDREYAHTYEYCLSLCDDSMSTSAVIDWGNTDASFYLNILGVSYKLEFSGLPNPGEPQEFKDNTGDKIDPENNSNTITIAKANYTVHCNQNGTYVNLKTYNPYKYKPGKAYIVAEKYPNTSWKGILIKGASYNKPAHCKLGASTDVQYPGVPGGGQGRLGFTVLGYNIADDKNDKLSTLDKSHKTSATTDYIDMECNSYNCGLSSNEYGYSWRTLYITKTEYKETLKVNPSSVKIGNKTYKAKVKKDGKNKTGTVNFGAKACTKTTKINVTKPSVPKGYTVKFAGWDISKAGGSNGSTENDTNKDMDITWEHCAKDENAVVTLTAKWTLEEDPVITTPPPSPTPIPAVSPKARLIVNYNEWEYSRNSANQVTSGYKNKHTNDLGWSLVFDGESYAPINNSTMSYYLKLDEYANNSSKYGYTVPSGYEYNGNVFQDWGLKWNSGHGPGSSCSVCGKLTASGADADGYDAQYPIFAIKNTDALGDLSGCLYVTRNTDGTISSAIRHSYENVAAWNLRSSNTHILTIKYTPKEYTMNIEGNGGQFLDGTGAFVSSKTTQYRYNTDRWFCYDTQLVDTATMPAFNKVHGSGHAGVDYNTAQIDGKNREMISKPFREGYIFNGWQIKTGTEEDDVTSTNWISSYNGMNATDVSNVTTTVEAQWEAKEHKITVHNRNPENYTRTEGAKLLKDSNGTDTATEDSIDIYGDTWESTYTYEVPKNIAVADGKTLVAELPTPYCRGYKLTGFSFSESSYTPDIEVEKVTGDDGVEYYRFKGNITDKLTFTKQSVTLDDGTVSYIWTYTEESGTEVHLYPCWEEVPWTLTIDTEGVNLVDKVNVNIKNATIHGDVIKKHFYYDASGQSSTTIQDTTVAGPSRYDTIYGELSKYGHYLPYRDEWEVVDGGGTTTSWKTYTAGTSSDIYTFVAEYNNDFDGDATVQLNWQPNEHTITIDPNGGTFQLSNGDLLSTPYTKTMYYGKEVDFGLGSGLGYDITGNGKNLDSVTTPTRYGYDFIGWKITSGQGQIEIIDADTNEVAKVDANRNQFTYNDGDEIDETAEAGLTELTYPYDNCVSKFDPENYYVLDSVDINIAQDKKYLYYYNNEPDEEAGDNGLNWDGDVTITAMWKARSHTLTVDNNGGRYALTGATKVINGQTFDHIETDIWSKTFTVGTPIDFSNQNTSGYFTPSQGKIQSAPIRYGYKFRYWHVDPLLDAKDLDKTTEIQTIDTKTTDKEKYAVEKIYNKLMVGGSTYNLWDYMSRLDGDVTIKAHWLENLYNLTVDPNGGEFYRPSNQNGIEEAWTSDKYTRNFVFGKETTFSTKHKITYKPYKEDTTNPEDISIEGAVSEPMRRGYTLTGWSEPLNNSGQHVTTGDLGATIQNKVIDTLLGHIQDGAWQYTADYAGDVTISAIWNNGQKTETGDPYGNAYSIKYEKGLTDCSDDKIPTPNPQYTNYDKDVTLYNKGELTGRSYEITLNNGLDYDKDGVYKAGIGIYIKEDNENRDVSTRSTYKIDSSTISGNLEFNGWDVQKEVEGWTGKYGLNSEDDIEYKVYDFTTVHYQAGQTVTKANFTSVPDGQVTATARYDSKTITLSNPTLQGYTFQGWYTQPNGGGTKVTSITIDEATTKYEIKLYAYWKPNTYIIRYNGNGHWNTTQDVYTQTITFDKSETLTASKFNRNSSNPGYTYNGDKLAEGYSFVGWEKGTKGEDTTPLVQTAIGTGKSITYTDKASGIFNMTDKQGEIIDLYAIWKKSLSVAFDLNGGLYDGKTTIDKLETTVWNSTYQHTFDITQYYGTVGNNGINTKVQKVDDKGNTYRFLGWSLNKNATVPDNNFIVYDSNRTNKYTIWDDKTLYAVWEKLLVVDYTLDRTLSNLNPTSESIMPQLKNITAITNNPIASVVIKPGEQGSYKLSIHGTPVYVDTLFTEKATNIYSLDELAKWKDNLNPPNEAEAFSEKDKTTCGLNKKWVTPNVSSNIMRNFYVPVYYNVVYPDDTLLTFTHTIQQESYYYKYWVDGKDKEEITITSVVFIKIKDGIPSTLDELKALIKTNVVQ